MMKNNALVRAAILAAFFIAPAHAQNPGAVTANAFAVGSGLGASGFASVLCTQAQIAIGQSAAKPICAALTGDVTMTAGGVTAIGANKITNPQMRQSAALSLIGRSANSTGNVADISATPGSSCVFMESSSALTCATIATANIANSAVTNAKFANMATNTVKANATAGSAAPTDVAVPSCSTASSALTWTTNTGFGCNSIAGGGAWSNTRLAVTAARAAVTGDCGSTIAAGGSAQYAITFNAGSNYAAACAFLVLNEDAAWGKLIVPQIASSSTSFAIGTGSKAFTTTAGLPIIVYDVFNSSQRYRVYSLANPANYMVGTVSAYTGTTLTIVVDAVGGSGTFTDWQIAPEIRLWPGQSRWVFNQNSVMKMDPPERWKQPGPTELCVDVGGNDSNDGLGATPTRCLQHIAYAASLMYQDWDANHFPPNIGLYTGPFDENVIVRGQMVGYNFININTRANNVWGNTNGAATGANASCIAVSDFAIVRFVAQYTFPQIWQCNTANSLGAAAIYGHQADIVDVVGSHNFQYLGSNHAALFEDGEGRATLAGDTLGGLAGGMMFGSGSASSGNSIVRCDGPCKVTVGGTLAWNTGALSLGAFYVVKSGGLISHGANFSGTPGTIGASIVQGGGATLKANGLTLPGGAPTPSGGATAGGATYCATGC